MILDEQLRRVGREVAIVKQALAAGLRRGQATVTATPGGGVVTIDYHGTRLDAHYLAAYSPTVGDTVWLLHEGGDILVLGKQA